MLNSTILLTVRTALIIRTFMTGLLFT
jgi:hypothetical protein